jgi:hypothetical protein
MSGRPIQGINLKDLQNDIGRVLSDLTGLPYEATVVAIDFEPSGQNRRSTDETELRMRLVTPGSLFRDIKDDAF